jgi:hypothetical protein
MPLCGRRKFCWAANEIERKQSPGVVRVTAPASAAADSAIRWRSGRETPALHPSLARSPGTSSGDSIQRLHRAPAAGYRLNASGALTSVGTEGNYPSSSPNLSGNHTTGIMSFNASNVNPLNSGTRSSARTVRCVQASASCFPVRLAPAESGLRSLDPDFKGS